MLAPLACKEHRCKTKGLCPKEVQGNFLNRTPILIEYIVRYKLYIAQEQEHCSKDNIAIGLLVLHIGDKKEVKNQDTEGLDGDKYVIEGAYQKHTQDLTQ